MAVTNNRRRAPLFLLMAAALALVGCSQASPDGGSGSGDSGSNSSGANPSDSSATGSTGSASGSGGSSGSSAATSSASPTKAASLGARCGEIFSVSGVNSAIGRAVVGKTSDVLGVPEPNIRRLAYLNCRFGIPATVAGKPAPEPQVEIGISLYDSAQQAKSRVQGTVDGYLSQGSSQQATVVDQYPATVLYGRGSPTLVVAAGPRTVAVTVAAKLIPNNGAQALARLAVLALDGTAHFTEPEAAGESASGGGTASASVTPTAS